ncbi:hypothetical protein JNL27_03115 [bacterium]|nr:hypothetical protein [bacterium]
MIDKNQFKLIREKHGFYASWAIWRDASDKPKSNMSDMSIFDIDLNPKILYQLNPNVMMVGLNFSRNVEKKEFINFHDKNPHAQDFKIRYAFKDTPFYGAYMTDVIKYHEDVNSKNVLKKIKKDPSIIHTNLKIFREEIIDLGSKEKPMILAFGAIVFELLSTYLEAENYIKLIKLTHYSHQISKEEYKASILRELSLNAEA